jgi:hypothetical protein
MVKPLTAWARSYLFHEYGEIYLSKELMEIIEDISKRLRNKQPVTVAEIDWVEAELHATPGYAEWEARGMLEGALHIRKPS